MVISPDVLSFLTLLPFLIGIPAVAIGIWLQVRRRKQIRVWAAASGWTYVGTDPSLARRWRGEPFGRGSSPHVTDLMVGRWGGRPATSFTYTYTTGSGKDESTHTFHVIALALPAYLSTLELTPEGVGTRLARAFGAQDIQFESEDFNRAWRVRASDAKFAHDVLHPRMMERLLAGDAQGLSIWILGTELLCWVPGGADLEAVDERLAVLDAIVDAIPRFVWLEHGYDPGIDLEADVPVPAQALASRTSRRPLVSATARAVNRDWSYIIGTTLSVLVTTALTVVLVYIGAAELATMTGVLAAFLILGAVGRSLIGRSRRKTRGRP